jgi:3-deoxy-D-manno-octulosonic-acid transferase
MTRFVACASEWFYRGIEWTDDWIGLPEHVSKTLLYRKNWQHFVSESALKSSAKASLWIHGASVGELEDLASLFLDAKNLAKIDFTPESCILTSSSSSSELRLTAWQERLGYRYAGPLPPENSGQIDEFLELLNPEVLIINQNDLWPRLLSRLSRRKNFRGIIWLPAGKKNLPRLSSHLLHSGLLGVGFRSASDMERWRPRFEGSNLDLRVIGNPRIDRILERIWECSTEGEGHILTDFRARPDSDKISFLLGSLWKEDAKVWREALDQLSEENRSRLQLVALPHDSENLHEVASIRQLLPEARVLALQGVLLEAYQGFSAAFVGGGFGDGLHNILEPLLWKIPVASGPRIDNQSDARRLAQDGVLKVANDGRELAKILSTILADKTALDSWRDKAAHESNFLEDSRGAISRLLITIRDLVGREPR